MSLSRSFRCISLSLVSASTLVAFAQAPISQQLRYSTEHRDTAISLPQQIGGPAKVAARLNAQRSAISVAVTSFHRNGTQDLLTGYATATGGALVLQNGAPEALAPTEREFAAFPAGQPVTPFRENGTAIELPIRPDLLLASNMRGTGTGDVLTAQIGDSTAYFLAGDGNGGFAAPLPIALRAGVTALSTWRSSNGDMLLVAAVNAGKHGYGIQFLALDGTEIAFISTMGQVASFETDYLNNASLPDLLFVAGGQATVLDGDSILTGNPAFEFVGPSNSVAVAPGRFVWDKRGFMQVAVLTSDATLRIFARPGLDASDLTPAERLANRKASVSPHERIAPPRLLDAGWNEVETTGGIGEGYDAKAVLLHGRFTAGGMEDLLVLTRGRTYEVAHPVKALGVMQTTPAFVTVDSTPAPVVAAAAARLSADSRLGFVTAGGGIQPYATVPPTRTTYYVNISSDGYHSPTNCTISNNTTCSLRDALAATAANRQTGTPSSVDKIIVAVSTTLATQNNYIDQQGDINYHFNVETSVNIVGSQACTLNSAGVATVCPVVIDGANKDLIFAINSSSTSSSGTYFSPYAVFMSNLQLQNGINNDNPNGTANGSYAANLGGIIYDDVDGSGSLTLNTMVINRGTSTYGYINGAGGCIGILNSGAGSTVGSAEIDNSTISSCTSSVATEEGGALNVATDINLSATNNLWSGNSVALGGGAISENQSQLANASTITGNVFTGNSAQGQGGAIDYESEVTISNSTFTGNQVLGSIESSNGGGGGGAVDAYTTDGAINILYSTFTGNTVSYSGAGGAGLLLDGTAATGTVYPVSVTYSRLHGNTGGVAGGQGLQSGSPTLNTGGTGRTVLTATNNWWGCNTDPQTTGTNCDGAKSYTGNDASFTTSPFTTLTLGINNPTPSYGTTFVATASLGQNSSGTVYTAANDAAYLATPITTFTITNTGFVTYTPSATAFSSSAATATSYAAATASGAINATGSGTATLKVDGFSLTKTYTVTAPDLTVTSTHSGNFKAGDTADTYSLTVANIGNAATSGTVTVVDSLPSGFTATAISGTGWTCTLSSVTCTRSDALSASVTYPAITLTVSVNSADAGTYTNTATVSGGGEANVNNDNGTDSTIVIGTSTIAEAFSPTSVAPNVNSTVTFTLGNPSANVVSLTGVAFTDSLPSGLVVSTPSGASTTCTSGSVTAAANGSSIALSGATIAAGATCTVSVSVVSHAAGNYNNTTGNVTATNSNAGSTASATLAVGVTPTKLVFTSVPPSPITAGGNAGTVSIALEDASGNVNTSSNGTTVTLAVSGPSSYSQTYSATTTNGVASINLSSVPLTVAGTYTYTATSSGLTQAQSTEIVNPGADNSLYFTTQPASPINSGGNAGTVKVVILDTYGNIETTDSTTSVTLKVTMTGYSQTYSATAQSGVATFNLSTVALTASGTYTYTATSGTITPVSTMEVVSMAAPTVSASFSPATVVSDGTNASTSTLTIVLTNSNSTAITGVAFTDMFPNQIQIISPPQNTCGAFINSSGDTVTFSGGTIPANSSCSITVSVIAAVATGTTGTYTDSTGTVTSTNAPNGTAATATLRVNLPTTSQNPAGLTVARSGTLTFGVQFTYPVVTGQPTPTGAVTILVDGSAGSLSTPACVFKNGSAGPHTSCSVTYTAPSTPGTHTLTYSQAADSNYTSTGGSGTITVQ